MSSAVALFCDCTEDCHETFLAPGACAPSEARYRAHRLGWTVDTLPGGDTVDAAPGHVLRGAA